MRWRAERWDAWARWASVAAPFPASFVLQGRSPSLLVGDPGVMLLRAGQVGTGDTPLVGAYSTHGWAHPGPAISWLAAPLAHLAPGRPWASALTAALVGLACVAGIGLATTRGRGTDRATPAVVAVTLALALAGIGAQRLLTIWNPILPLLPLLLLCFCAWRAATGSPGWATPALVLAALVAQAHIAFVPLAALAVGWMLLWAVLVAPRWADRATEPDPGHPPDDPPGPGTVRGAVASLARPVARGVIGGVLAWVPPLIDQVAGTGNLHTMARALAAGEGPTRGVRGAVGVVSRYVGPGGAWMGGPNPVQDFSVGGAGVLPVLGTGLALVLAVAALHRLGDHEAVAGAVLALVLLVASVPLAARVPLPVSEYLVAWLTVVGAFGWTWVLLALWRVVAALPRRPSAAVATALSLVLVVAAAGWSVRLAAIEPPRWDDEARTLALVAEELERVLPRHRPVRLEARGDQLGQALATLVPVLLRDGYDIRTSDGASGQKYGTAARWQPGDHLEDVYTVVVTYAGSLRGLADRCRDAADTAPLIDVDLLGPADREWLRDHLYRVPLGGGPSTDEEDRRAAELRRRDPAVSVFVGPEVCAPPP